MRTRDIYEDGPIKKIATHEAFMYDFSKTTKSEEHNEMSNRQTTISQKLL